MSSGNTCILLLFGGLGMCSLANPFFYSKTRKELESNENTSHIPDEYIPFLSDSDMGYAEMWGIAGMTLMWLGVLIPIINYRRYHNFREITLLTRPKEAPKRWQRDRASCILQR
jgi:hypothetical protein